MLVSSNTCRFCLILVDNENVPLFHDENALSLPKKIMEVADVQVIEGDGLPSVICPSCFAQLELSHQFKLQVEKADKILREEISVNAVLPTEFVEWRNDEPVKNESAQININYVFQEDTRPVEFLCEDESTGDQKETHTGEAEEHSKNIGRFHVHFEVHRLLPHIRFLEKVGVKDFGFHCRMIQNTDGKVCKW